jgi:hypothetical protein
MNNEQAIKLLETQGYKIIEIGKKGKKPYLIDVPLANMTTEQRRLYLWRQDNQEHIKAYQREYYKKRKEAKLQQTERETLVL